MDPSEAPPDASVDARVADAGFDAAVIDAAVIDSALIDSALIDSALIDSSVPDVPPARPTCVGQSETSESGGQVRGSVPIGEFAFPFVTANIDSDGSHSCPRLFFRAGEDELFAGDRMELQIFFNEEMRAPDPHEAHMEVFIGGEFWEETIVVDVERADGLIDLSVPFEDRLASLRIEHHDATSDIVGYARNVAYTCSDFPFCI